jgi:hypothetical protein
MPKQGTQRIIHLHAISTKNHAWLTFSFKPFLPNATSSEKAALARESDEVWLDSPQIETPHSRSGGNRLSRRVVARDALVLGSSRLAKRLDQRSACSSGRSDHTFPPAGNSGLQVCRFRIAKEYDDDSHEPEIFAARNW